MVNSAKNECMVSVHSSKQSRTILVTSSVTNAPAFTLVQSQNRMGFHFHFWPRPILTERNNLHILTRGSLEHNSLFLNEDNVYY